MSKPSQLNSTPHHISHRWTIDAFSHKLFRKYPYFSSSTFTSTASKCSLSPHFQLRVYPNGVTDELKDYLSVGLSLDSIAEQHKLVVQCQVSLIDIKGQKQNTKELFCYFSSAKSCSMFDQFISKSNLLDLSARLVHNNKLTIYCEVTILSEPSTVELFYKFAPDLRFIAKFNSDLMVELYHDLALKHQKNEFPDFVPLDLAPSHILLEETMTRHNAACSFTFESSICDEEYSPVLCVDSNPNLKFKLKWEFSPGDSFLTMCITYLSAPNIFVDCTVIGKEIGSHSKRRKHLRQKHFLREFSEDSNEIKVEFDFRPNYREEVHISLNMTIYQGFSRKLEFPELKSREQTLLDLKSMLEGGKHCDVVLLVEDKQFRAHKAILSAQSNVFEAMFSHDMKEKIENLVEMHDVKVQVFERVLIYLYTGKVDFESLKAYVLDLFVFADMHFLSTLSQMCLRVFGQSLSPESVAEQFELADRVGLIEFKQVCVDYMNKTN